MLAAEYGWTKDYILECVYPLDMIMLQPAMQHRKLNEFVDQLTIQVMTDSNLDQKGRTEVLTALNGMRSHSTGAPPPREFDRKKFEELRKAMGKRKGKAPQRAG